jgi:hypothetical protein
MAHADKYNKNLPQVGAALAKAQKVYLLKHYDVNNPKSMDPEFVTFVQDIEALDRFQVVTDAREADVVLTYVWNGGNARVIDVMDEATHTFIGSYRKTIGVKDNAENVTKTLAWLAAYTKSLAGASTAATPTVAVTVPPLPPPTDDQARALLQAAKTVFLIDGGVDKKFPHPGGKKYAAGQLMTLFKAQLAQQGRYRVVDNAKDADVLFEIGAYEVGDTESTGNRSTYQNGVYTGEVATYQTTYTPEIELDAWDGKTLTLQHHWSENYQKKLKDKSADPRNVGACRIAGDLNAFLSGSATAPPCG